jgi:putative transcriptional regulator
MKKETFDELLTSVEQGGTILRSKKAPNRSFRIDNPNVLAIRRHLGLTQQKFAGLLGISPATLRNWEQGRRKPEGAGDLHVRKDISGEPRCKVRRVQDHVQNPGGKCRPERNGLQPLGAITVRLENFSG